MVEFLEQEFYDEKGCIIDFYGCGKYLPPASLTPGIAITSKNNGRKYKIIEHEFIRDENEKDKKVKITVKEI